jgi:hypothetical protein
MKKIFIALLIILSFTVSCQDDCSQDAYVQEIGLTFKGADDDKVYVCHNGMTLEINKDSLKEHLAHGDYEGECQVLSDHSLSFGDGEIVQISCDYELPFTYTDPNTNKTYIYTKP